MRLVAGVSIRTIGSIPRRVAADGDAVEDGTDEVGTRRVQACVRQTNMVFAAEVSHGTDDRAVRMFGDHERFTGRQYGGRVHNDVAIPKPGFIE